MFLLLFLDIDECLSNPCNPNASCSDNQGSYDCQCNSGYSGNGFTCTGKQVYIEDKGINISTKMDILNKNDVFCLDIDECSQNTNNCSTNATCSNKPGSFDCQCNDGFSGDGISCSSKTIFFTCV